jgi:hypothetical protein
MKRVSLKLPTRQFSPIFICLTTSLDQTESNIGPVYRSVAGV